jgi:hypothetical protein
MEIKMKPIYKLENWAIVYNDYNPYTAPELKKQYLNGLRDNKHIKTSSIIGKTGEYIATKNSLYLLGETNPEYEAMFPNARDRVFNSLSEVK